MYGKILPIALSTALLSSPLLAQNPYLQQDDTWISVSGTVERVSPDSFVLDYGDGSIIVEMTDRDRDADAYKLISGDEVTVNGLIDDDFFETTSINASAVYVESIDTWFYANALVEKEGVASITPVVVDKAVVQGTVTEVNDEEFTLNTGQRQLTVKVDELAANPLDGEGYQQIQVGDMVSVSGELDADLIVDQILEADSVVTLVNYGA